MVVAIKAKAIRSCAATGNRQEVEVMSEWLMVSDSIKIRRLFRFQSNLLQAFA